MNEDVLPVRVFVSSGFVPAVSGAQTMNEDDGQLTVFLVVVSSKPAPQRAP